MDRAFLYEDDGGKIARMAGAIIMSGLVRVADQVAPETCHNRGCQSHADSGF